MEQNSTYKPVILVVDDDPNICRTLHDILGIKGYTVEIANQGEAGVKAAEQKSISVALVDLKLPDISGIEVMQRIKSFSPLTEFIILTGHASLESAIKATNAGAFSYQLKPYEMEDLLLNIRRACERQQAQKEILRLSSYPRLDPQPVIEIDSDDKITYMNPAAEKIFPELVCKGEMHPLLVALGATLTELRQTAEQKEIIREFQIDGATYEAHIYYVQNEMVRIRVMNISERKQHEHDMQQLNSRLCVNLRINEYLLTADHDQRIFQYICDALLDIDTVDGVCLGLKSSGKSIKPVAWSGFGACNISDKDIFWNARNGVAARAIYEGKPVVTDNLEGIPCADFCKDDENVKNFHSVAIVPFVVEGKIIGTLVIFSKQQNVFDDGLVDFFQHVSNSVGIGWRALNLNKKLSMTLENLRESLKGTVEAIARLIEMRDPYTAGHERRVARLSTAIGREMALPERQIEGLSITGYIHDIGKIVVPAEILSKPGKLDLHEFGLIMAHSQVGYDILKSLKFPWPVAKAVLQHHERLDGSGYPEGLKGDSIILEARILMVADVVESMSSHRPYRPALGLEAALAEIIDNKNILYDADVVDVCVRLFRVKGFQFD